MILAHLADLHLGFRAYDRLEGGRNQREADVSGTFLRAVDELVRLAPAAVLVAGDVFDRPDPPTGALIALTRGLETLRQALPRTAVLLAAGPRDTPLRTDGDPGVLAALDTLPGVSAASGAARVVALAGGTLNVHLLPHRAALLGAAATPDPGARWNVLVTHARLPTAGPDGPPAGLRLDPSAWDYVALGGEHVAHALAPHVRWAGSLERVGWAPWDEALEEKGFLTWDLEAGRGAFHPLPARPVVSLAPIRVPPGDPDGLRRRVREVTDEVPGGIDGKIVRVRVRGAAPADLGSLAEELLPALRDRALHLSVGLERGPAPAPGAAEELGPRLAALLVEEGVPTGEAPARAAALLGEPSPAGAS